VYNYLCNQYLSPTTIVSSNHVYGEVYSIPHNVIKFVSDLRQVGGFLWVLRFPPTIKLTGYSWNIVESGAKYHEPRPYCLEDITTLLKSIVSFAFGLRKMICYHNLGQTLLCLSIALTTILLHFFSIFSDIMRAYFSMVDHERPVAIISASG
jgi:hypothetical protein